MLDPFALSRQSQDLVAVLIGIPLRGNVILLQEMLQGAMQRLLADAEDLLQRSYVTSDLRAMT